MGSALRLHPLLVIFGLLAGAEIYGSGRRARRAAAARSRPAVWEFFAERVGWSRGRRTVHLLWRSNWKRRRRRPLRRSVRAA
jgi:hypothetical protein